MDYNNDLPNPFRFALLYYAGFTGVAMVASLARWRNWYNPSDMPTLDGQRNPRAGKFSYIKMFSDLTFVPGLSILGVVGLKIMGILNISWGGSAVVGIVALCAMLGSSFFLTAFEKARDVIIGAIGKRIGGGT